MIKLKGNVTPYMLGLVLGITVFSTVTANQARLQNEYYKSSYIEEKKKYISKMANSMSSYILTEELTSDSSISIQKLEKYFYTNIFSSNNISPELKQGGQLDGEKISTISNESNEYNKNKVTSVSDVNSLKQDYSNESTRVFNEKTVRDLQIKKSYENMKKQAEYFYNLISLSIEKKWPCTFISTKKDAWGRDFNFNRLDDFNAEISFNLPWDTSIKKALSIKLPALPLPSDEIDYVDSMNGNTAMVITTGSKVFGAGYNIKNVLGVGNGSDIIVWTDTELTNFKELKTVSNSASYAILNNNELWVAGSNSYGEFGMGDSAYAQPIWAKSAENVKFIEGTYSQSSYLVKNDGTLWVSGRNTDGQLGLGNLTSTRTWTQTSLTDVKKVYTTKYGTSSRKNAYAVLENGDVWATGENSNGQLGIGNTLDQSSWQKTNLVNPVKILFGTSGAFAYALMPGNTIKATGAGSSGQMGNGSTASKLSWTETLTGVQDLVVAGIGSIFAIKQNGDLFVTGYNNYGNLGVGTSSNVMTWRDTGLKNVKYVGWGDYENTLVIDGSNSLYVAGKNTTGSLGVGHTSEHGTFTKVLDNVKQAYAGSKYVSYALKYDGTVWASGENGNGQLGIGSTTDSNVWQQMLNVTNINKISFPKHLSYVNLYMIDDNGDLWAVGRNSDGQLGAGDKIDKRTPVKVLNKSELGGGVGSC